MKRILVFVISCLFALGCFVLSGCGSSQPDEIKTDEAGITNLDAEALMYVYDNDIVDLGMTFDEVSKAMGGAGALMDSAEFGENVYCYYTKDGKGNICISFADRDGVLKVTSLSTNL